MTTEQINALIEKRARAWEAAKAILDASKDADLSGEQRAAFDKANADIDVLDGDIRSMLEAEKRANEIAELRKSMPGAVMPGAPAGNAGEARDLNAELRSVLTGESRFVEFVPEKRFATDFERRALLGTDVERRALIASGSTGNITPVTGSSVTTTNFVASLLEYSVVQSAVLNNCSVIYTSTGDKMTWPRVKARSSAAIITEGSAITASEPQFDQVSLSAYKYALSLQISRELVEDTNVDLLGFVARQSGTAIGLAAGADFLTGTGAGAKPKGLTLDATIGVTGGTGVAGLFTSDNLIDLHYSVIAPYRVNAKWIMQDVTLGSVRKLKDSQGRYLWEPSLVPGVPDTLLGKPIVTDPGMPATGVNNLSVAFGAIDTYQVRAVNGVRFEESRDFAFTSDLITYKVTWRADGILTDITGAVKTFKGAAT